MLPTAGERLSSRQLARLQYILAVDDLTEEIGAAWACKERLRQLLPARGHDRTSQALCRFYNACHAADTPETTRLATTVETWWPAPLVALQHDITNARTEGFNRVIK